MLAAHRMQALEHNSFVSQARCYATPVPDKQSIVLACNAKCMQSRCKGHRDTSRTRPVASPLHACHEKKPDGGVLPFPCAMSRQQMRVVTRAAHMPARDQGAVFDLQRDLCIVPMGGWRHDEILHPSGRSWEAGRRAKQATGYDLLRAAESAAKGA